jgi:hypothetical protein
MAFALVHFYQEDAWDVIPSSDIILGEKHQENDTVVGIKTLVSWQGDKGKRSKGKYAEYPAEIIKIAG